MSGTNDYSRWTKESLVKQVQLLEKELHKYQKTSQAAEEKTPPQPVDLVAPLEAPSAVPGGATATTSENEQQQQRQQQQEPKPKKRKKGVVDPSRYSTRFVALKIAYLGKNYNGFEYQQNGALPSVEEELWKALVKTCLIFPENPDEVDFSVCDYSKCGRTDRGVSAFGQVIALRLRSNRPVRGSSAARRKLQAQSDDGNGNGSTTAGKEGTAAAIAAAEEGLGIEETPEIEGGGQHAKPEEDAEDEPPYPVADEIKYPRVLNRILPPDIRVLAWCPTPPPGFSARFSCLERQYRYFFTQPAFSPTPAQLEKGGSGNKNGSPSSPVKDGWLDIEAMRTAASRFEGLHDFRNFCKIDPSKQITNYARRVYQAEIVELPGLASEVPYLGKPEFQPPEDSSSSSSSNASSETAAAGAAALPKVYYFHVRGSAFLWHQIRHMVAVLFLVGQGLEQPSIVPELLNVEKYPSSPNYTLASDAPLVLWDCVFGRDAERPDDPVGNVAEGLEWVYAGEDGSSSADLHGKRGLVDVLWANWRGAKVDELLANRLLDRVAELTKRRPDRISSSSSSSQQQQQQRSQKLFLGGDEAAYTGAYVPLAKRPLGQSSKEANDKWAQKKGFANAEAMRGTENWRGVIKANRDRKGNNGGGDGEGGELLPAH